MSEPVVIEQAQIIKRVVYVDKHTTDAAVRRAMQVAVIESLRDRDRAEGRGSYPPSDGKVGEMVFQVVFKL